MKLFFLSLFICPVISFGQLKINDPIFKEADPNRHIPNKSNVIYAHGVDFRSVCDALLDLGFHLKSKDNELGSAETDYDFNELKIAGNVWMPVISVRMKDSVAIIKTKCYTGTFFGWSPGYYDANKKGRPKQNALVYAFVNGLKIATMITKEITYETEPFL